jgi:hypothetical protein
LGIVRLITPRNLITARRGVNRGSQSRSSKLGGEWTVSFFSLSPFFLLDKIRENAGART